MTFLNSILLWGGLAVSIPIIIHFLNRRRAPKKMGPPHKRRDAASDMK